MGKGRLEAFSDGVVAILITILVLEFKAPEGTDLEALRPLLPVFLAYVLSFVYIGIYWNNHHHMIYLATRVTGPILWANLHLLFWLSLFPFATAWLDHGHFAAAPTAVYGAVLMMAALAYTILQQVIIASQGEHSPLRKAVRSDWKGKASLACYAIAIATAQVWPPGALALYAFVAAMWLVPDRRIERILAAGQA